MPRPSFFRLRRPFQEALIKSANIVFNEKDYHALKVADFCSGMDLPIGTFYEYFENKEDLCVYLASRVFQENIDAYGKETLAVFNFKKPGFSLFSDSLTPLGDISYEKILNCGVGFFAKLFDEYLLDMIMPLYTEGITERIAQGQYREDVDIRFASYIFSLISVFYLHYFGKYEITDPGEQEASILSLFNAVDRAMKND